MPKIDSPKFGAWIKEQLFQLNMTQAELAGRIGVKDSYLSDILSNKRIARRKRLEIVKVLEGMESEATRS